MSKIVSFAHTTVAMLAGQKTVTRREWNDAYGARFRAGELVQAYNRSPRVHGVALATIRLTEQPRPEPLSAMPPEDYEREGFAWMLAHPTGTPKTLWGEPFDRFTLTREWFERCRRSDDAMWVVRFELVAYHRENILAHVSAAHRELIHGALEGDRRERHAWLLEAAAVPT